MSFFTVEALSAGYGGKHILRDASFRVEAGSLVGILGVNGSGKTTLLKSVCGILPHTGSCMLEDERLEGLTPRHLARLCSYIPQRSGIAIDISALDVVLMGWNPQLGLLERPTRQMREKAMEMLAEVGLSGKEHTNYLHLSEGQKQLCILARTLVAGSKLLLLDEPESALDFHFRYHLLHLLRQWVAQRERAAIVTLHDPMLALNRCDQLLILSGGRVESVLYPGTEDLEVLEKALSGLYGSVSLQRCENRRGQPQLVMLKEEP